MREYAAEHEYFGCAISEVAKIFGVDRGTVYDWMRKYPEFESVINELRNSIDDKVENALLKAALGYTYEEKKLIKDGTSKDAEVIQAQIVQRYKPADANAARFWLINRKGIAWKEKQAVEAQTNLTITVEDDSEDYR